MDDLICPLRIHARYIAAGRQRQRGQQLDEQAQRVSAQAMGAFARRRHQVECTGHGAQSSGGSRAKHDLAEIVPLERAHQRGHATERPAFDRAQIKWRGGIRRR